MANEEVRSQQWIDRIEGLVHDAESIADAKARSIAVDLLQAVLELHAAALERIIEIVAASGAPGETAMARLADDELTGSVLLLHGLHPDDLETRVRRALEKMQRLFNSRDASISLISLEDGIVRLQFDSTRKSSAAPVRAAIESAMYQAAPEIRSVVIEGFPDPAPPDFVPVSNLFAGSRL